MPAKLPDAQHPRLSGVGTLTLLLAVVFGALVLIWSVYQTRAQVRALEELTRVSGEALAESLGHAVEDSLRSAAETEELASARLLDQARLLDRLEDGGRLDTESLNRLAEALALSRVVFVDRQMQPRLDTSPQRHQAPPLPHKDALETFLERDADALVLGPGHLGHEGGTDFSAAVRWSRGGIVLVVMDAAEMLSFQAEIGPNHLLNAVAGTGGILYASLENLDGSPVVGAVPSALDMETEHREFERRVLIGHGWQGVLRVGMSAETLVAAKRNGRWRTVQLGVVLLGLVLATSVAALAAQRAAIVGGEVARARATADAVLEGMVDAVVLLDPQRVIRLVNPAASRLLGHGEELVGKTCDESTCSSLSGVLEGGQRVGEVELERSDGSTTPVLASVSTIHVPTTGQIGTAILLRDLEQIRTLETRTRRAESHAALGRLAAAVAHEIRNPLNAIAVGTQRLSREFRPTTSGSEYARLIEVVREEVVRMDGIVDRFLDLSRTPRLDPRPGNLDPLIRDLLPLLDQRSSEGVTLACELAAPGDTIFDSTALRQVILNLVYNATEAVDRGGTVRIRTAADDDSTILEVIDDGRGIPQSHKDHLFEYGFTTKPEGTGLGLAIVHQLVHEMGGSVSLESSTNGGTVARVELPRADKRIPHE
jgi:PAS domain S-box-containing protein